MAGDDSTTRSLDTVDDLDLPVDASADTPANDVRASTDLDTDVTPSLGLDTDELFGPDDDVDSIPDVFDPADLDHSSGGGDDGDTGDDDVVPVAERPRGKLDKGLLAACFVIAGGMVLIAWGLLTAQTGDDGIDRPEVIENISPVENALQVLQQETIVVDFEFGFEAELILDGIALETTRIGELDFDGLEPGQQVATPPTAVFDPGNSRIEFRPSPGAQIEELTEGRHTATVIYWPIEEGRQSARSYTWSFDVI